MPSPNWPDQSGGLGRYISPHNFRGHDGLSAECTPGSPHAVIASSGNDNCNAVFVNQPVW